jgi:hypothetical protein
MIKYESIYKSKEVLKEVKSKIYLDEVMYYKTNNLDRYTTDFNRFSDKIIKFGDKIKSSNVISEIDLKYMPCFIKYRFGKYSSSGTSNPYDVFYPYSDYFMNGFKGEGDYILNPSMSTNLHLTSNVSLKSKNKDVVKLFGRQFIIYACELSFYINIKDINAIHRFEDEEFNSKTVTKPIWLGLDNTVLELDIDKRDQGDLGYLMFKSHVSTYYGLS